MIVSSTSISDLNFQLMCAAKIGQLDAIKSLVALGADVNYDTPVYLSLIGAELGDTPLMLLAAGGRIESLLFLIEAGANIHYRNPATGASALECSIYMETLNFHKDCARLLIQKGATIGQDMIELLDYLEADWNRYDIRPEIMAYQEQYLLRQKIDTNVHGDHDAFSL